MSLAVAIQMDPINSIDIDADSTFALALEAQERGHGLYHYLPRELSLREGRVVANVRPLVVRRETDNHFTLGEAVNVDLATMDVVLMRQDPPFDMAYISATHLLEHIHPSTLVVNDPVHVRNAPEKLFVTHFDELMPPTLITTDAQEIHEFRERYEDIVIKPLFGNGGSGVFHVSPQDENLNALLEMFTEFYREPIMVQKYLPAVREGDKRIILVDGEVVGGVSRVPKEGEARANMHVGARPEKTEITPREQEICDAIGPSLRENGLVFVGIDVIGGFLTEINVTSPTGIQEIDRFDDVNLSGLIWDAIEERYRTISHVARS
ncbi:MAG: glutathione synthase [Alphaproteobacteria bacterium]|nr:glutathione synthase [Alphaproteobacteria bacterium]